MNVSDLNSAAERLSLVLLRRGWFVATAESCTGGLVAQCMTALDGASTWFDRGFVTYSNAAKMDCLGVTSDTLSAYGAVSAQAAAEMVQGVLQHSRADLAVSITGIAGPTGGSAEKPVGTVWFGFSVRDDATVTEKRVFVGDRLEVRRQAALHALQRLVEVAETSGPSVA